MLTKFVISALLIGSISAFANGNDNDCGTTAVNAEAIRAIKEKYAAIAKDEKNLAGLAQVAIINACDPLTFERIAGRISKDVPYRPHCGVGLYFFNGFALNQFIKQKIAEGYDPDDVCLAPTTQFQGM